VARHSAGVLSGLTGPCSARIRWSSACDVPTVGTIANRRRSSSLAAARDEPLVVAEPVPGVAALEPALQTARVEPLEVGRRGVHETPPATARTRLDQFVSLTQRFSARCAVQASICSGVRMRSTSIW
jgi:hypothetical protein